jgi:hypothetical protein
MQAYTSNTSHTITVVFHSASAYKTQTTPPSSTVYMIREKNRKEIVSLKMAHEACYAYTRKDDIMYKV